MSLSEGTFKIAVQDVVGGDRHDRAPSLPAALLVGAAAMVIRYFLDRRAGHERRAVVHGLVVRPVPTVVIGMVGGLIVGMTSVGSGSLMIVMLLFLYPMLGANQLVGTDLTQAVPLTAAAALAPWPWVTSSSRSPRRSSSGVFPP